MNELDKVTIAARAFAVAVVLGLSATTRELRAVEAALAVGLIATTAAVVTLRTRMPDSWVSAGEALLVALLVGASYPVSVVMLPYLAIPGLIAGVARGTRAVAWVLVAETAGLLVIHWLTGAPTDPGRWAIIAPWLGAALGIGLLGSLLRQMGKVPDQVLDDSYVAAHRLLTQLRTVARHLSGGLDPVGMASQLLTAVEGPLEGGASALFVRTEGGVLAPLAYLPLSAEQHLSPEDDAVLACWEEGEPAHASDGRGGVRSAFPLRVGGRMLGVLLTDSSAARRPEVKTAVMKELGGLSLNLDTALVFDEVRSMATAEERRRLSREIHDGIAQEVASLGYLVDDLAATADSDDQRARLRELRLELTRMVTELRLSIFDLRSEVTRSAGLGSALSEYVRQIGSKSELTVHLTLDEAPTRLRTEVEMELLRITQEAITNARKHSHARNLWVDCRVKPPFAQIEVRDDGDGMAEGRADSYGVRVMRERAARIGARLDIGSEGSESARPGTMVRLTLGDETGMQGPNTHIGREEEDLSWGTTPLRRR